MSNQRFMLDLSQCGYHMLRAVRADVSSTMCVPVPRVLCEGGATSPYRTIKGSRFYRSLIYEFVSGWNLESGGIRFAANYIDDSNRLFSGPGIVVADDEIDIQFFS